MSINPLVSVVIPTHNGRRFLGRTLSALARQVDGFRQFEVIIVDNASTEDVLATDEARAAVERISAAGVPFRTTREEKLGLTAARVHGVERAAASVVCFLDDDNEVCDGYLAEGIRHFSDPSVGLLVLVC